MFENATFHEYGQTTQDASGWRGWYDDSEGVCIGFEGIDGHRVAFNAATGDVSEGE